MKHVYASVSATVLALFLASPAYATDLGRGSIKDGTDVPYTSDGPARSWTGLWLGAVGGYQITNSELTFDANRVEGDGGPELGKVTDSEHLGIDGLGADGLFGELQLGFDKQIGNRFVLGVFGGVNISDAEFKIDASVFDSGDTSPNQSADILTMEQKWGAVIGPRIGYLPSQNTMIYLAGGYAFGEVGQAQSDFANGGKGGDVFKKQETDLSGWFGEVGLETRLKDLGENVYFKIAGRYTDYEALTLDSKSGACDKETKDQCSGSIELDPDQLAIMAGLTIKLGGTLPYIGN